MPLQLLCWGNTDVGRKRDHNEDCYLINRRMGLVVVADGMGGHAGGELASRIAVEIIDRELGAAHGEEGAAPSGDRFRHAIEIASQEIFRISREVSELEGMGTTVTGLYADGEALVLAHVGDSRAYQVRWGDVTQLSQDHSLVAEQVRSGLLTAEDAKSSRLRHIITRSVGFEADTDVDIRVVSVREGDVLVLCSDGLANHVEPDEIAHVVAAGTLPDAPRRLIALANERGGDDNITVIVSYVARAGEMD
ncbi:MAG TPA: Stp1/IreP family PP2C-type Ser/Thr phosphatase [Myxococcota bacterium]|jgi:protein phosphatase|nr:Stp1/IreP family PP2C-type Ser/Thr phosphatase [Myxococcota bacterium]